MTLHEAIERVDAVKPNTFSMEDKVRWLAYLEGIIKAETIDSYEEDKPKDTLIIFPEPVTDEDGNLLPPPVKREVDTRYTAENLGDSLLAPYPYDELYVAYLKMKIDEENGETTRYNNSATIFNAYYEDYLKAYNKAHMPISRRAILK